MASQCELAKIDNALYCCEDCNVLFTSINSLEKHNCKFDRSKVKVENVKQHTDVQDVLENIEINLTNSGFSTNASQAETDHQNYGRLEELAAVADTTEANNANQHVGASLEDLAEIANNSNADYGSAKLQELATIANNIKEAEGQTSDGGESNVEVTVEEPENNRLMQLLKADKFQSNFRTFLDAYEEIIEQSEVVVESENTPGATNNSRTDGVRFAQGKRKRKQSVEQNEENEISVKELVVDLKTDGTEENGVIKIVNDKDKDVAAKEAGGDDGSFHNQVGEILRKHAQHWAGPKTSYQCEFCQDSFTEHSQLLEHSMIHVAYNSEEKNLMYKCHECHETFATLAMLKNHTILHSVDTCFKCEICSKLFALKGNLIKHLKLHSGERLHECSECGKVFSLKGNLVKHMLLHTGVKAFHCTICDKYFALKGNLLKHMLTHTGEKLFQCFACYKTFSLKGNLDKHMTVHSEDNEKFNKGKVSCIICQKVLSSKSTLDKHVKTMHGDGKTPVKRQVRRAKPNVKKLFDNIQGKGEVDADELPEVLSENDDGVYYVSVNNDDTDGDDDMEEEEIESYEKERFLVARGREPEKVESIENGASSDGTGDRGDGSDAVAPDSEETTATNVSEIAESEVHETTVSAENQSPPKKLKVLKIIVVNKPV